MDRNQKQSIRRRISDNVVRKRDIQRQIRQLRDSKKYRVTSISSHIKQSRDKNAKANLRNEKTRVVESYNYQIVQLQNRIASINNENANLRSSMR